MFPKGIVFPALVFLPLTFLSACCCLSPSVLGSVGLQAHAQISYTVRGTAGRCCDAEISLEGAAMSAPSKQVAAGNGQALASPKCSTFLWFALPEMVETQTMH